MTLLQAASGSPPLRTMFLLNIVVVVSVVGFAAAVIRALLLRSYQRRVEEEKLAAIGTATARILHQIKNPLQTIVLHSDLLQERTIVEDPVARKEVADAIVSESQRLVTMLDELSVYASGSRRTLSRRPTPLHDVVLEVAATERREAAGTGIHVETAGIRPATVLADPYYLRQVFENLVRNAREAMEGQADARVSLHVDRFGPQAAVRVIDNGPGIPPEKLDRVFEPFVSTKGKGMGLGLAICREIVEAHAGRIEVQSRAGEGTSFLVFLPLHEEPAAVGAGVAEDSWS